MCCPLFLHRWSPPDCVQVVCACGAASPAPGAGGAACTGASAGQEAAAEQAQGGSHTAQIGSSAWWLCLPLSLAFAADPLCAGAGPAGQRRHPHAGLHRPAGLPEGALGPLRCAVLRCGCCAVLAAARSTGWAGLRCRAPAPPPFSDLRRLASTPSRRRLPCTVLLFLSSSHQGVDLIRDNYDWMMGEGVQLVLLGSGREDLEAELR